MHSLPPGPQDAADVILLQKSLLVLEAGVVRGRVTHGCAAFCRRAAGSGAGTGAGAAAPCCWSRSRRQAPSRA